jgi:multicomponent Na+:H+ antiporter subunit A
VTLVLAAHLIVVAAALLWGRSLGRAVFVVGALAPLTALAWAVSVAPAVLGGDAQVVSAAWVESLGLTIDLRIDAFSLLMVLVVSAIGVLVFAYSTFYFTPRADLGGFAATLVGFAGAMLGVVTADNVLVLFVFWELTSVTSFLLIGFDDRSATARAAALKALLVTGIGGMAMLAGLVMVGQEAESYSLSEILANPPTTPTVTAGLVLVLIGAFAKSAQVPFHFWLPGAMAAPTPVSAYLHSATMVKAGVYLIARLAPVFGPLIGVWRPLVMTVGLATMILGGWRALAEEDMKLILAMGTVSQLGFLVVLVGYGDPGLTRAGAALILAHAVFKAALFMVVGVVDRQIGTRNLRKLAGWGRNMPVIWWVAVVSVASMAGLPPLLGFVAKEEAFRALLAVPGGAVVLVGVAIGSGLTAAYGLHLLRGSRLPPPAESVAETVSPARGLFVAAPALLAGVTVVAGVFPRLIEDLVVGAAASVDVRTAGSHLSLWHGLEPALAWSTAALALGLLVWRMPPRPLRRITSLVPEASQAYNNTLRYLNRAADRVTSVVQSGSLPVYLQIILATAVVLPGFRLVRSWVPELDGPLVDSPLRLVVASAVVLAAAGVALARRRMGAVLFLGAIGYGVAVLFVLHGAPDLALTQLLVETLSLAMFVMVLRHLPDRWEVVRWRASQTSRVVISLAVALLMGCFALWAAAGRVARPIAQDYVDLAQPEGGGGNVVNVILTDFRGFDTIGEITVISLAAVGCIVLLGRAHRRPSPAEEEAT